MQVDPKFIVLIYVFVQRSVVSFLDSVQFFFVFKGEYLAYVYGNLNACTRIWKQKDFVDFYKYS